MKSLVSLLFVGATLLVVVLGCGDSSSNSSQNTSSVQPAANNAAAPVAEASPIAIQAKNLTKEYDDNELAADGKYKDKLLAVTGKISNIAETLGNATVQLEGHQMLQTVMCSFEDDQKATVATLKKGQTVTLVGTGDGSTGGLYVGLQKCTVMK